MDWEDIESNGIIEKRGSSRLKRESGAIRLKSDKYHEKFKFLVSCFLWCYSWIRPPEGQQYVIYKGDKKVRKPYPIIPLVAAWMVKWFNDNDGNKGKGRYKKISAIDMFLMWGLAFHKETYYYKQWESKNPDFYRGEKPPEVFLLALKDYDKSRFYGISLDKYTQYITKSFFRERLVEAFDGFEKWYANWDTWLSDDGQYVEGITKSDLELFGFFFKGTENFLTHLDLGKAVLDQITDRQEKNRLKDGRAVAKIQSYLRSELLSKDDELHSSFFPEGYKPFFHSVQDSWDILYGKYASRIDKRLYGIDGEKYSYKLEQIS